MADSTARWYVVHTYSGYENKVAANIEKIVENRGFQDLIKEVRIPTEIVTEHKESGKSTEVERKIFPGYVLVKMVITDDSWYVVRNTRGVTGFVGPASQPVPLSDEEVAALGVEKKSVEVNLAAGDSIRITDGPFNGFVGTVMNVDAASKIVKATVSMFGRDTTVELELHQTQKME